MQNDGTKTFLFRVMCGFFLGVSVVAPGVSGSIMAVMMGIYRELIEIASNPFKNFKDNVLYLLPMGIGGLASLIIFVKLLAFTFDKYETQSQILFIGLIAGGLIEVYQQVKKADTRWYYSLAAFVAFGIVLGIGFLESSGGEVQTAGFSMGYLCIAGGVAGALSIVPGMSVSLVLMLFGVYNYLLQTASAFTTDLMAVLSIAVPVGLCFVAGLILVSKVIKILFDRYPGFAYFMVLGFMGGTLATIFPDQLPVTAVGWILCGFLFLAGLLISIGFQLLGRKFKAEE